MTRLCDRQVDPELALERDDLRCRRAGREKPIGLGDRDGRSRVRRVERENEDRNGNRAGDRREDEPAHPPGTGSRSVA